MKDERLVRYNWTEDGVPEMCQQTEGDVSEDCACYHCDQLIPSGQKAVYLTSMEDGEMYVLHPECAKRSCSFVGPKQKLKAALQEAVALEDARLEVELKGVPAHEFSEEFEQKMEDLIEGV